MKCRFGKAYIYVVLNIVIFFFNYNNNNFFF